MARQRFCSECVGVAGVLDAKRADGCPLKCRHDRGRTQRFREIAPSANVCARPTFDVKHERRVFVANDFQVMNRHTAHCEFDLPTPASNLIRRPAADFERRKRWRPLLDLADETGGRPLDIFGRRDRRIGQLRHWPLDVVRFARAAQ